MDIFGRAGQVVNFRLVYDKETGQPKGFGFLEYTDTDAAASAVRNLNDYELNGRTLRVDYSNDNRATGGNTNNSQNQSQNQEGNRPPQPAHFSVNVSQANGRPDPSAIPPLPPGTELPPGVTAYDAISKTINQIPTPQLIDFISQIKGLCASNQQQAMSLLHQAPQLAFAVFQAMTLLDLVDSNIIQQLIASVPVPAQPPPQSMPPMPQGFPPPPHGYPPPIPQGYPPGYGGAPAGYAPTPPQQPMYQPPPQVAPVPQAPPQAGSQALIDQVKALSKDQIYALPEPARSQIIMLRQQYGVPV